MINFLAVDTTVIYHTEATLPDGRVVSVVFEHDMELPLVDKEMFPNTLFSEPREELIDVNILANVAPYTMEELEPLLLQEFLKWKKGEKQI